MLSWIEASNWRMVEEDLRETLPYLSRVLRRCAVQAWVDGSWRDVRVLEMIFSTTKEHRKRIEELTTNASDEDVKWMWRDAEPQVEDMQSQLNRVLSENERAVYRSVLEREYNAWASRFILLTTFIFGVFAAACWWKAIQFEPERQILEAAVGITSVTVGLFFMWLALCGCVSHREMDELVKRITNKNN